MGRAISMERRSTAEAITATAMAAGSYSDLHQMVPRVCFMRSRVAAKGSSLSLVLSLTRWEIFMERPMQAAAMAAVAAAAALYSGLSIKLFSTRGAGPLRVILNVRPL